MTSASENVGTTNAFSYEIDRLAATGARSVAVGSDGSLSVRTTTFAVDPCAYRLAEVGVILEGEGGRKILAVRIAVDVDLDNASSANGKAVRGEQSR